MLDILMFATHLPPWGPGPPLEPPGWWEGLFDDLKITDIAIVIFTILLVFFTGLLAKFTSRLVLSHRDLWRTTRDTTRLVERANLGVEPQGIETLTWDGEQTLAYIGIRNTGHLPARNVVWAGHIDAPYPNDRKSFDVTGKERGPFVVPAGSVETFGTDRICATKISKRPGENFYCYVWGEVRYHDGFHEPRHTKFCHRYPIKMRTDGGKIHRKHARQHEHGNEAN